MDGVPPSEAALRRRRRAAALGTCLGESAMPGTAALGTRELEQESGGSEADARWHLVTALRCLSDSFELQCHFEVQGFQGAAVGLDPVAEVADGRWKNTGATFAGTVPVPKGEDLWGAGVIEGR